MYSDIISISAAAISLAACSMVSLCMHWTYNISGTIFILLGINKSIHINPIETFYTATHLNIDHMLYSIRCCFHNIILNLMCFVFPTY